MLFYLELESKGNLFEYKQSVWPKTLNAYFAGEKYTLGIIIVTYYLLTFGSFRYTLKSMLFAKHCLTDHVNVVIVSWSGVFANN